jgi:2',3'-cyclic-nucleotide 2'-phosphodiesterase (5'-nucleotidase family)
MKRIRTGVLLLALVCPGAFARQVPVTIACTAELRAPLSDGAMPRLIARLQHLREEERNLLLLDAGGWSAGSPLAALDPSLMPAFISQLHPNVMVPGRAELSAGFHSLRPAPGRAFPWTAANLLLPAPKPGAAPDPPPSASSTWTASACWWSV